MNDNFPFLPPEQEWLEFAQFRPGHLTLIGFRRLFWDLPRVARKAKLNYFTNVYYNRHAQIFYVSNALAKAFWASIVTDYQAKVSTHPGWAFPTLTWNFDREDVQRILQEADAVQQQRLQITSDGSPAVLSGYIIGEWPHIFPSDHERLVRWVYDLTTERVPFVQVYIQGVWSDATEGERLDVEESVQQHELERTWQDYDCELTFELPEWAKTSE
jgi:hypothetical protein